MGLNLDYFLSSDWPLCGLAAGVNLAVGHNSLTEVGAAEGYPFDGAVVEVDAGEVGLVEVGKAEAGFHQVSLS